MVIRGNCFSSKRAKSKLPTLSKAKKCDVSPVFSFPFKKEQSPLLKRANCSFIKSELHFHEEQIALVFEKVKIAIHSFFSHLSFLKSKRAKRKRVIERKSEEQKSERAKSKRAKE